MMDQMDFNRGLCDFLQASPTPFHAVATMVAALENAGFQALDEAGSWKLEAGKAYYLTRNQSSLIAFRLGNSPLVETGMQMVGAHTDSPNLRIKPQPEIHKAGYLQLGVEVYGGALLNPWFDRDLSIAGRVTFLNEDGSLASCLLDFRDPVAVIPSLAIHLDRDANQSRSINKQTDLPPLFLQGEKGAKYSFNEILLQRLRSTPGGERAERVLEHELSLYDVQAPALVGLNQEFLAAARLDNLLSCYTGLLGLLAADGEVSSLLVCNDHEEVGSVSSAGAGGPFLEATLERISAARAPRGGRADALRRILNRSLLLSVDNAHGIHPNYMDRHDANHGPLLNQGPVIKINANQRYASNSETAARFRRLCELEEVPVQSFVVRSDMGCGSTIGPIVSAQLGIPTVDLGVPTFAMHSIRELAGSQDAWMLARVLRRFFSLA